LDNERWHDPDEAHVEADIIHRIADLKYKGGATRENLPKASRYKDAGRTQYAFAREFGPFDEFYKEQHEKFKAAIAREIQDGQKIIDIGANTGTAISYIDEAARNCHVIAVDSDQEALEKINDRKLNSTTVKTFHFDANDFLDSRPPVDADTVIIHATLHEINDPDNRDAYLDSLFKNLDFVLKEGGNVIIGDYYYGPDVTEDQVKEFMAFQLASIEHADERKKFIEPDLLIQKAAENGFIVSGEVFDMRAATKCDRRYYLATFEDVSHLFDKLMKELSPGGLPEDAKNEWSTCLNVLNGLKAGEKIPDYLLDEKPKLDEYLTHQLHGDSRLLHVIKAQKGFSQEAADKYDQTVTRYNLALASGFSEDDLREELIKICSEMMEVFNGGK